MHITVLFRDHYFTKWKTEKLRMIFPLSCSDFTILYYLQISGVHRVKTTVEVEVELITFGIFSHAR